MTRCVPLALFTALVLTACADDGSPAQQGSAVVITSDTAAASPAPDRPADSPTSEPSSEPSSDQPSPTGTPSSTTGAPTVAPRVGDPKVAAIVVADFDRPVDLAVRTGDPALYLVEQPGRVVQFADDRSIVVADISDRTEADGERGLLGLVFSEAGDAAYLNYTNLDGDTVIAEYPVDDDGMFDTGAERLLLTVDQPYGNHNGGDLAIDPDGMLLIALGDGGSANDPQRHASNPADLLGSLLRIDPRPDGDRPYSIPPDNPFAGGDFEGIEGAPEIWSWGLRNPWKIAFDPITEELWIADVGQNALEEINVVGPVGDTTAGRGSNFGWSAFEGTERFNTDVADTDPVPPVLTYRHGSDGCSVSGGVPYRGTAIAELTPAYIYSDWCSGIVWALDLAGQRNLTLLDGFESVSAVRAGPDGEVYVLERTGALHRLVPG